MKPEPFTLAELAGRIGKSLDWFYRPGNLDGLYAEGMPRPLSARGWKKFDRVSMEAWLQRHHPANGGAAANDRLPPPEPANDEAWRRRIAHEYAP